MEQGAPSKCVKLDIVDFLKVKIQDDDCLVSKRNREKSVAVWPATFNSSRSCHGATRCLYRVSNIKVCDLKVLKTFSIFLKIVEMILLH